MRAFFRLLSLMADVRAAFRGPGALGMRLARKRAHRSVTRYMR